MFISSSYSILKSAKISKSSLTSGKSIYFITSGEIIFSKFYFPKDNEKEVIVGIRDF
jgi:hypothetical protein